MNRKAVRLYSFSLALLCGTLAANAQDEGYVSAALESNSISYMNDKASGAKRPEGGLGSNNYLKVDFGKGFLEGGIQVEDYLPALQGYPSELEGFFLSSKYIRIRDKGFTATFGDFYDQFGSGLLFRAYEERSLGLNTAVEGIHLAYSIDDKFTVKGLLGRPKYYNTYSDVSRVAGVDFSTNLMSLAGSDLFSLLVEGSFFNKFQELESDWMSGVISPSVSGYSARAGFEWQGFGLKGEYVIRDADASLFNAYNTSKSRAALVEASFTHGGLGANVTFRKLDNAGFQSNYNENRMFTSLNYIPSLTQQHTYALASLNPYVSQVAGEVGGQADIYYFIPRKTTLGGSKGMRVHGNFSTYYGPGAAANSSNELYFRDLTLDAERWFGKQLKAIMLYTWQTYNNRVGAHPSYEVFRSHTIVADVTYKFDSKHSLRGEYQHLWTAQDKGNWMDVLLEYNVSPGFSISVADMWNYGSTGTHYFNGSVSYSHSRSRFALNFGRFREGYQCAGGVCRLIPAYTGANLSITTSF